MPNLFAQAQRNFWQITAGLYDFNWKHKVMTTMKRLQISDLRTFFKKAYEYHKGEP